MIVYKTSLLIFHRNCRLSDSRALNAALEQSEKVLCVFIVDPAFNKKPVTRRFAKQFMLGALSSIHERLQAHGSGLCVLYGAPQKVLPVFLQEQGIDAVFCQRDYTPQALERENMLRNLLQSRDIPLKLFDDVLLFPPGFILKHDGTPYTVFTPFYNRAKQFVVEAVDVSGKNNFSKVPVSYLLDARKLAKEWHVDIPDFNFDNERKALLQSFAQFKNYETGRDFPAQKGTTRLSAYLKCGAISPREAYWAIVKQLGSDSPLLRQLYWRDFFTHIGYFFPHVFRYSFVQKFGHIHWENSLEKFRCWCEGKTGFPIVDAGMRELNTTGFMHNRVRMITASFLVKNLHIDWRWGERYFAENLIDHDNAVNNGNWQWAASTGCDAQPYFRIFNPWLQQKKFDAKCQYIYQWVPELRQLSPGEIHQWNQGNSSLFDSDYPRPIIDHAQSVAQTKRMYMESVAHFKKLSDNYDKSDTDQVNDVTFR